MGRKFWITTAIGAAVASVAGATLCVAIPAPWGGIANAAVMVAWAAWVGYRLGKRWDFQ